MEKEFSFCLGQQKVSCEEDPTLVQVISHVGQNAARFLFSLLFIQRWALCIYFSGLNVMKGLGK